MPADRTSHDAKIQRGGFNVGLSRSTLHSRQLLSYANVFARGSTLAIPPEYTRSGNETEAGRLLFWLNSYKTPLPSDRYWDPAPAIAREAEIKDSRDRAAHRNVEERQQAFDEGKAARLKFILNPSCSRSSGRMLWDKDFSDGFYNDSSFEQRLTYAKEHMATRRLGRRAFPYHP